MLKESILDSLYAKRQNPAEFNFETLQAPSMYNFLSEYDIARLYDICTSIRYSSKTDKKIQAIKEILRPRGFVQYANGTNRMCFRYLEDKSFVLKVAYKKSGLDNGFREYQNQQVLKPFVCKTFEVHPSGAVSMHERVLPITNREEFLSVADDVFELLTSITGKYVLDDAGSEYFMNFGIRSGFGVVIIDYVDLYELDGRKLYCNRPLIPNTKFPLCGGLIDLDDGFNRFVCTKCGKEYSGSDLQKAIENKDIILEGDINMKVSLVRNGQVVAVSDDETNTIVRPNATVTRERRPRYNKVGLIRYTNIEPVKEEPVVKEEPTEKVDSNVTIGEYPDGDKYDIDTRTRNDVKKNPAKINIKLDNKQKEEETSKTDIKSIVEDNTKLLKEECEEEQFNLIQEHANKFGLDINDLAMINESLMREGHNITLMNLDGEHLDKIFTVMAEKKREAIEESMRRAAARQDNTLSAQKQLDKDTTKPKRLESKFIPTNTTDLDNY